MHFRLLARLEKEAQTSTDRVTWARSVCRAASQFARQGLTSDAASAIERVRHVFGTELDPEVATWLMLAEGVVHFTAGDQVAALDRIRRADGIAVAFDLKRARPTCAAWLSHIQFNLSNFDAMQEHLKRSLFEAEPDDHQALSRASLVLADAYHYSGNFSLARPWYDRSRLHATAEGDEAMIGALLYNVAAFRAANVLLSHALGEAVPVEAHRARMEASSAANYDSAVGTRSFESLTVLLAGQLMLIDDKVHEAFVRLSSIDPLSLPKRLRAVLACDLALCALLLERTTEARAFCQAATAEITDAMDDDDAAYAWSRLSSVHRAIGELDSAETMAANASAAMVRLRSTRDRLKHQLDECARVALAREAEK